jgi:hypothetical protein
MVRVALAIAAVLLALAVTGCGGDDEPTRAAGGATTTSEAATDQEATETAAAPETETGDTPPQETDTGPSSSPEDSPGGAGDEKPARTLVQFTGKDGQILPRFAVVPPYIGIRVELRSTDGRKYGLDFGEGKRIEVGGQVASASTQLEPLISSARRSGASTAEGSSVMLRARDAVNP